MKFRYSHKDFPAIIIIDTEPPENAKGVLIQNVSRPVVGKKYKEVGNMAKWSGQANEAIRKNIGEVCEQVTITLDERYRGLEGRGR